MSDKVKTIRETLNHIATKEEFVELKEEVLRAAETLVDFVKKIKEQNSKDIESVKTEINNTANSILNSLSAKNSTEFGVLSVKFEELVQKVDNRLESLKDGLDGKNADEEEIVKQVIVKLKKDKFTKEEIRDSLEQFGGRDRLKMSSVRGIKEEFDKLKKKIKKTQVQKNYSVIGHYKSLDQSLITADGTVDNSNVVFGFAYKPVILCINGAFYREGKGWAWDGTNSQVTIDNPVGTGGDIYALV